MQTNSPLVSILIVTLNGGKNLKDCLSSLKKITYPNFEIVVVINGGKKSINQEIKRFFRHAKIVAFAKNIGFASGNNRGVTYCKGNFILLLNDDTIVTPDFLSSLMVEAQKDKKTAVFQPKIIFQNGLLQAGGDYLTNFRFLYHFGYGKNPDDAIYNDPLYIYSANGSCMLIRREIINRIGLFDDDFFTYFEEPDFCHRVWISGHKVVYLPKSVVFHKGAETSKSIKYSILFYHPFKNRLCSYLKNFSLTDLIKTIPFTLGIYQLFFIYYLFKKKFREAFYVQKSIWWNIKNIKSTLFKRKKIQKEIRKLADKEIIPSIFYQPRLSYFRNLFFNLSEYQDKRLPREKYIRPDDYPYHNKLTSILIASFSLWKNNKRTTLNGNVEPLLDFFVPRTEKVLFIDQPIPGSDRVISMIEKFNNGLHEYPSSPRWLSFLYPLLKMTNNHGTRIIFKIRDFFSVVDVCMKQSSSFDYFIGLEAINALAGIIMRKIGRINKVIYYVSDYSPIRYKRKWFNSLYLRLDRYSAENADFIWDVSNAIHPARIEAGLDPRKSAPVMNVPNALYPNQINYVPAGDIKTNTLVYVGTLGVENGPDLAIDALPGILKKFPKTTLHIIGGGDKEMKRLVDLSSSLNLSEKVKFYGLVTDRNKISRLIKFFQIGLAPYTGLKGSPRYYGDSTKIRLYLAAGLPVITTKVPPLGKELVKHKAGIVINDNSTELTKAVIKMFSDRSLYLSLRNHAYKFARNNTWNNVFCTVLKEMDKLEKNNLH